MIVSKWLTNGYDYAVAETISSELSMGMLPAKLLSSRGIDSVEDARRLLIKDISALNDPFLLTDMDMAVARIKTAIESREKLAVYGDYDVDGTTSTYILKTALERAGLEVVYYIPSRDNDGYGVNSDALKALFERGVTLLITVDTGITALEEIASASEYGLDVIVCDHHECLSELPRALAVINPHRSDCNYPFKFLAGVGVTYKLICALGLSSTDYLPFVALGTIADIMPIINENRAIVSNGLSLMASSDNIGLRALIDALSIKELTASTIGYTVAPTLNAAGRLENADIVIRLFCETDKAEAKALAEHLIELNTDRKRLESDMYKQACAQIEKDALTNDSFILVYDSDWHPGVIGIVASRLCQRYHRPSIALTVDGDTAKGSGRSVSDINIHKILSAASELVDKFGGHEQAVGLTLKAENILPLRARLNAVAQEYISDLDFSLVMDFDAGPEDLTLEEIDSLSVLEPFGTGNAPAFLRMVDCLVTKITPVGEGKHLKIQIENDVVFECMFFRKTLSELQFSVGDRIDIAFNPTINEFRGNRTVTLMLRNARLTESMLDEWLRVMNCAPAIASKSLFSSQDELRISYEELGGVWRLLKSHAHSPICFTRFEIPSVHILIALEIFKELGLLEYEIQFTMINVTLSENVKNSVENSEIYKLYSGEYV